MTAFFAGPKRNQRLWWTLGLGLISASAAWLTSPTLLAPPFLNIWFSGIGIAVAALGLAVLGARVAPAAKDIPPLAATIGREGWEALATALAIIVILLAVILPIVVMLQAVFASADTSATAVPLACLGFGLAAGGATAWLLRAKLEGPVGVLNILGVFVTFFSAIRFALAPAFGK